jgi:hypothetical protein
MVEVEDSVEVKATISVVAEGLMSLDPLLEDMATLALVELILYKRY